LTHPKWLIEHVPGINKDTKVIIVILSNATVVASDATYLCDDILYWNLYDFRNFANKLIAFAISLTSIYAKSTGLHWNDYLKNEYIKRSYHPEKLKDRLKKMTDLEAK